MTRALVFDSGVGGLSVADAIVAAGLDLELDYVADNAWLPYGDKPDAALRARVPALLAALAGALEPDIVVLACNTASTIALDAVRARLGPPVVGVVPPIKPAAAATRSGAIGVLATPATVARPYVDDLIAQFAADKTVVRFGSTRLVAAAEAKLAGRPVDEGALSEAIDGLFGVGAAVDVVALACTHFPLLRDELAAAAPAGVLWLDSGEAIARRVAALTGLTLGGGQARLRRAAFTDAARGRAAWPAFEARGFNSLAAIGAEPGFMIAPMPAIAAG